MHARSHRRIHVARAHVQSRLPFSLLVSCSTRCGSLLLPLLLLPLSWLRLLDCSHVIPFSSSSLFVVCAYVCACACVFDLPVHAFLLPSFLPASLSLPLVSLIFLQVELINATQRDTHRYRDTAAASLFVMRITSISPCASLTRSLTLTSIPPVLSHRLQPLPLYDEYRWRDTISLSLTRAHVDSSRQDDRLHEATRLGELESRQSIYAVHRRGRRCWE